MSKFKVGDKVRVNGKDEYTSVGLIEGTIVEVKEVLDDVVRVAAPDPKDGDNWHFYLDEVDLIETPKGVFDRLLVESLPQGGYKVTSVDPIYANTRNELAAFTTLPEAVAFVGRNMR